MECFKEALSWRTSLSHPAPHSQHEKCCKSILHGVFLHGDNLTHSHSHVNRRIGPIADNSAVSYITTCSLCVMVLRSGQTDVNQTWLAKKPICSNGKVQKGKKKFTSASREFIKGQEKSANLKMWEMWEGSVIGTWQYRHPPRYHCLGKLY